jgi:hypothetical protein
VGVLGPALRLKWGFGEGALREGEVGCGFSWRGGGVMCGFFCCVGGNVCEGLGVMGGLLDGEERGVCGVIIVCMCVFFSCFPLS